MDIRNQFTQRGASGRDRNEPKNLRICDLQTLKKSLLAHLCLFYERIHVDVKTQRLPNQY